MSSLAKEIDGEKYREERNRRENAMKTTPKPPKGWRAMRHGTIIRKGDKYMRDGCLCNAPVCSIGNTFGRGLLPYFRRKPPVTKREMLDWLDEAYCASPHLRNEEACHKAVCRIVRNARGQ